MHLDFFSRAFHTASCIIPISKLRRSNLNENTGRQLHNSLDSYIQRVIIDGLMSDWEQVSKGAACRVVVVAILHNISIMIWRMGMSA